MIRFILQWILLTIIIQNLIKFLKWLYWKKIERSKIFDQQSIKYPKTSYWFGNLPEFRLNQHRTLIKWYHKFCNEKCFGFFLADQPILVINDIDTIKELLIENGKKFSNRLKSNIDLEPFKSSILNEEDDIWKHTRKILTPPFTAHKISMETTRKSINKSVNRLIESIEKKFQQNQNHQQQWININDHMNSATLDIICRLAFNMNNNDVHDPDSKLLNMVTEFMNLTSDTTLQFIEYFPKLSILLKFLFYFVGNGKLQTTIVENLHQEINNYYKDKENFRKKTNILDYMIEQMQAKQLNQLQLIGNSLVILLAGYETTSTSLSFTFYLLAKYPEWQQKLREEIIENFNFDDNDEIDYCQFDRKRLELLDRIWYETLRLYPPVVSFITRRLQTNIDRYYCKNLNINITNDITIMIPTWIIHHNEYYWPKPNEFLPKRNGLPIPGTRKNLSFQAFGCGPRNCIGANLAISESRAVITSILLNYHLDIQTNPNDGNYFNEIEDNTGLLKLTCPTVIIHPKSNIWIRFTKISKTK